MFSEFKQKITRDYTRLTCILLLISTLTVYAGGVYMSCKDLFYQIKMLAVEECEDLYHLQKTKSRETALTNLANENISYFDRIFVYGYDNEHRLMFNHNNMEWSKEFLQKAMNESLFGYKKAYVHFEFVDKRHPKVFIAMRYPLMEKQDFLGEVYVGMDITHMVREEVRSFFVLIIIILLSMFFVRYVAYKMANKAMEPVVKSFERQKQFVSDASHELRTPISIIISGMEVLKADDTNKLSAFSQGVIQDINDEALKMKKLVDNLLITARNDNDTLMVNVGSFSLNDLLIKLYNKFSLLADKKNIAISLDLKEDFLVYADRLHVEQILAILIDNAVKYTQKTGKISIEAQRRKQKIVISVKDNGIGISQEDLPYIFDRFYRAQKSHTDYGNGLGLSIAKILAEKNNGDIIVKSRENIGSCFSLILKN